MNTLDATSPQDDSHLGVQQRFPLRADRWLLRSTDLRFGNLPRLMGIINVTPDSFSDGGRYFEVNAAVERGLRLVEEGADLLDVGGESTRPYSTPISEAEELRRVMPVVQALCQQTSVPVAIDTSKAKVAAEAIAAGAEIINDVTGLEGDAAMPSLAAKTQVGVCVMHMQGRPQTMQDDPKYENVVEDIFDYLRQRRDHLLQQGLANPQRPEYFWEFKESLLGMTHALTKVDTPIVGGNVSLYNETSGKGIWPTPMIGFVGKVAVELGQLPRSGWLEPNLQIVRLGKPAATLAGSAWQEIVANDLCGHLPEPDWHELLTLQKFMLAQIEAGNVLACRDIAEGGLLLTLAEMAFAHDIGFELDAGIWSAETLFGETGQNVLVATQAAMMPELLNAAAKVGLACDVIGSTGGDACIVPGMMKIPLAHAKKPWAEALPALVGETSS